MIRYKVTYVTSSRADYGIVRKYIELLNKDSEIDFSLLVTGSHLEEKFGYSINVIKEDGFRIDEEFPLSIESTEQSNIIHSMAICLDSFGRYFATNKCDLLILLGDRYEMLTVAIAAAMNGIPILHIHGGEITSGNYDEFIRHSITKMSQYHFTSTQIYRNRVIQLGEAPESVFYLGALGAENCQNIDESLVIDKVKALDSGKYWVVAFHPETLTDCSIEEQVEELLTAFENMENDNDIVFIGTNADTDSDKIRNKWLDYVAEHKNAYYFENLNPDSYLWLLKKSIALIGNSSSGIIEVPSLGRFTINIGDRQNGRVHGDSVIDVKCDSNAICNAMGRILENPDACAKMDNPYFRKDTAIGYYKTTKELLTRDKIVIKKFYDL